MSAPDAGLVLPPASADDRTNAMLVHVLAIFTGFIAPLVFFLVKRDSRFVVFHSLQVLIWHATYVVTFMVGMMTAVLIMILSLATTHSQAAGNQLPPLAFFGLFGFMWLWGMGGWALNLILGIVYGIRANQGEWARYPVIGNFVLQRILPHQPFS